ncbi:MAG: sugar phosphate isomerase/epimerase [Rhodocyclaceae bacterium]|nr:sugar phosphate isomerase/epimerase [Rhodocyclaceae bacterium]
MKIGISTNILDNPRNVLGSVEQLGKDFDAIEIEIAEEAQELILGSDRDAAEKETNRLKSFLTQSRVHASVHAAWFGKDTDLAAANENERQRSLALLRRSISFAQDLGVSQVTFHPGYVKKQSQSQQIFNLKTSLKEIVPEAAARGVTLTMENMGAERPAFCIFTPFELVELCEETGMRLTLDIIHLASLIPHGSVEFDTALAKLLPFTDELHIADMKGQCHRHLPIGVGDFPLMEILLRIEKLGFSGAAIVEEFVKEYSAEIYIQRAKAFKTRFDDRDSV